MDENGGGFWGGQKIGSAVELVNDIGIGPSRIIATERDQKIAALVGLWRGKRCAARDLWILTEFKEETANRRFGLWRLAGAKLTCLVLSPKGWREDFCQLSDDQTRLRRMIIVPPLEFDVVSFDHAIERLAVDTQHA